MTQYAMVIDLQKCVGCGACALACKTENNTAGRSGGQTHNWADFQNETTGKFPKTRYTSRPVLCNHCAKAACVKACPVTPKAMYKTKEGITMHDDARCIGCRACQDACPYSKVDVKGGETSVISYTGDEGTPYEPFYADKTEMIAGCTTAPAEIAAKIDNPPHRTKYDHPDYQDVRRSNITEKCIFCEHRVSKGELPNCVVACPAKARTFGDISDKNSEVAQLVKKYKGTVLKPEKGTKPNVYYIRSFSAAK
ncbi:MAG: 4Fe-4S dicluster domain-containing protein [Desulfurivibrionaceae bacterium]